MVDLDDPAPSDDLHAAIEQFYFAYRGFTDRPDRILERRGLGRVHHRILYFIGRRPDVSVRGLLDLLAVSKQALNAPLRQLMEMGLVRAEASPDDAASLARVRLPLLRCILASEWGKPSLQDDIALAMLRAVDRLVVIDPDMHDVLRRAVATLKRLH